MKISCSVINELVSKALRDLFFVLIVFIEAENMYCFHIKQ